jgi:hypothetical protein
MRAWTLLLALRRAAAEPCAPCMAAHPMHPFKWGACMPARDRCAAPNGVELLVVRGTGNKWYAEDFLDQLRYFAHGSRHLAGACDASSTWRWSEARTTVFVAPGTRTPHGLFALPIAERERQSYVAILRHPVMRVVSRYWFEGIWGQHQPEPETKLSLGAWVNKTRFPVFQKPNHLWNVPDNLYSKTFGGWRGEAACESVDPTCVGGVRAAMVGRAERALEHIDGLVLTEWLGAPAQIEFLARKYCFATDGRGRWPGGERPAWWHFHRPRRDARRPRTSLCVIDGVGGGARLTVESHRRWRRPRLEAAGGLGAFVGRVGFPRRPEQLGPAALRPRGGNGPSARRGVHRRCACSYAPRAGSARR